MEETTKEELLSIVKQISDLELQRIEIDGTIQELFLERLHLVVQTEIKISLEKDENGKVKYPNESLRKAALHLYLYSEKQYQEIENWLHELRLKDKKLAIMCVDWKARYQVLIAHATPSGGRVSFPSLQMEDINLLTAHATLPEKLQRLISSISDEPKTTTLRLTEEAKNELLHIRNRLSELDKKRAELGERRYKTSHQIQILEDKARLEISAKKDTKGKTIYGTERTRDSAIRLKLEDSDEYKQLVNELHNIDDESRKLYEELEDLREQENMLLDGSSAKFSS